MEVKIFDEFISCAGSMASQVGKWLKDNPNVIVVDTKITSDNGKLIYVVLYNVDKEMTARELMNLLPVEKRKEVLKMLEDVWQDMGCGGGPTMEVEAQYMVGKQIVEKTIKGNNDEETI